MSLDLYIKAPKPIKKRGTGVYIRENGGNRELETMEEVRQHFPDSDLSHISEYVYETDNAWHGNITHNLNKMAMQVPVGKYTLYEILWRPEEIGYQQVNADYAKELYLGFTYLKTHRDELEKFNPENGWGNYEILLSFCSSLVRAISTLDYESEKYTIVASR